MYAYVTFDNLYIFVYSIVNTIFLKYLVIGA